MAAPAADTNNTINRRSTNTASERPRPSDRSAAQQVGEPDFNIPLTGIDRALNNSDEWQIDGFRAAIDALPVGHVFAAEDVLDCDHFGLPVDHPNRAGAWMRYAHKIGLVERIGYRPARKASRNGSVVAVWRRTSRRAE